MMKIFVLLILIIIFQIEIGLCKQDQDQEKMRQRQKTEIMNFFLNEPSHSVVPQTPIAIDLYNQAVELFQDHEYKLAKGVLWQALSYDKRNPFMYELMGDIYYVEHELQRAKDFYKSGYLLRPSESLKNKIEKISRELKLGDDVRRWENERFIFKYQGDVRGERPEDVEEILLRTYSTLSSELSYNLKNKVVVLIYDLEEFKEITKSPHWIAGIYDGTIKIPKSSIGLIDFDMETLAMHELSHAFIGELSDKKAPSWINEGLAMHFESRVQPIDSMVFDAAIKTDSLLSIDQLLVEKKVTENKDPLYSRLFYEQAYDFVDFLLRKYGLFKVKQMLTEYKKDQNSDEVIEKVLGARVIDVSKSWESDIEARTG